MPTVILPCLWCGTQNAMYPVGPTFCRGQDCGHEVGEPRLRCGCPKCVAARTPPPVRVARRRKAARCRWGEWRGLPGRYPAE